MLVVGVDPSARKIAIASKHLVLNVASTHVFTLYKATEKQTVETMGKALRDMALFVQWADDIAGNGEKCAWVESPLVGRGGVTTTMKQAYVGGIIRATLHEAGFKVYDVNVSSWKADVIGNGRATKADVRRAVRTQWPKIESLAGNDGDLWDAAGIALYGERVLHKAKVAADARAARSGMS